MASIAVVVAVVVVGVYLIAAGWVRGRGHGWPVSRDVSFVGGGAALVWAGMGPLPGGPFTGHMAQHLLVAMAAPLLLVLGRPLTLLLRALPPGRLRRAFVRAGGWSVVRWLLFPPVAALLDVGGLWLLYRTPLAAALHHPLVQVHVLLAGLLFTFAVCQLDPLRHRWSLAWRGLTLLTAGAAHAVLAKSLYAEPPPGTTYPVADLQAGAQLMYYGGDLVELALAAVLAVQWYRSGARAHRQSTVVSPPPVRRSAARCRRR
ncbi:cytochrome c oxidase assembly protein [Actinokineospora sp. NPDC004072]